MANIMNTEFRMSVKDLIQIIVLVALAVTGYWGMASKAYVNEQDEKLSKRIEVGEKNDTGTAVDLAVIKYALGITVEREKQILSEIKIEKGKTQ